MDKTIDWVKHFASATLGHTLGVMVLGSLGVWYKSFRDGVSFSSYLGSPKELVSPAIIAVLVVSLVFQFVKRAKLAKLNKSHNDTLQMLGVRLVSRHHTVEEKSLDWSLIVDSFQKSSNNSELWILGANGVETFSASTSPLCNLLRTYNKPIRVLLLKPYSKGFNKRTSEINANAQKYADEIIDSIDFCAQLKTTHGRDIELKLYSEIAIWKMLRISSEVWLQNYAPNKPVEDMPLYCFRSLEADGNLYDAFVSVFSKRWLMDGNPQIDLSKWKRSMGTKKYWSSLQ
jgi:hypothetical protein